MGISPFHSASVGLVRNLQTGSITPQFHMVFDDYFQTVHANDTATPADWDNLITFHRQQAVIQGHLDEHPYTPELKEEWLSASEVNERRANIRRNSQATTDEREKTPGNPDPTETHQERDTPSDHRMPQQREQSGNQRETPPTQRPPSSYPTPK
jgi:hypothetical protein